MEDEEYQEPSLGSKIVPAITFVILTIFLLAGVYYLFVG